MTRQQILETLRQQIGQLEGTRRRGAVTARSSGSRSSGSRSSGSRSSGCAPLDRLLPERGFPGGTLVEWLASEEAAGAGTLALIAARQAAVSGGVIVVLDRRRSFYPPAAAALGMELERVLVVRADTQDDELWALDQALRCSGVVAVWGAVDKLNRRWFRRLQLAAECGGAVGHLLRPARVRGWPSWSYAQLWVEPCPARGKTAGGGRRWHIQLMRCHGSAQKGTGQHNSGQHGTVEDGLGRVGVGVVEVELDEVTGMFREGAIREAVHETRPVHLAAQLARSTSGRRSAPA